MLNIKCIVKLLNFLLFYCNCNCDVNNHFTAVESEKEIKLSLDNQAGRGSRWFQSTKNVGLSQIDFL